MKPSRSLLIIVPLLIVLIAVNIFFGSVHIAASQVWLALTGGDVEPAVRFIVLDSRLPQALTAALAGGTLAVAGLMLQTVFRNPLAGPSILGISSGASLGVAFVMLAGGTLISTLMPWAGMAFTTAGAFIGAFAVMLILMALAVWLPNELTLLIAGIMLGYISSSVITILNYTATADSIRGYVMWGMGSFSNVGPERLPWFAATCFISLVGALLLAKPLNIFRLGNDYARNLGLNVNAMRHRILIVTGLAVASVTAFCGPVGFIGLAVPHITALAVHRADHRILIPANMLCGAIIALLCNAVCILPARPLPLNAVTPVVGVPVILYLLLRRRR